jgi:DNA-binding transcriptional LysR family regulator
MHIPGCFTVLQLVWCEAVEFRHLRYFVAVAEELHFRRAAERLHISQPPLSEQISNLEEELGTRLLERDRAREVRLTAAGRVFLVEARRIVVQVEKARELVKRASRGEVDTMSISVAPAMAYGIVPQILRQFRTEFPDVGLHLSEMLTPVQEKAILDGSLDLGFCYGPIQSHHLDTKRIHLESLVLAVPGQHPIARLEATCLSELKNESFITIPRTISPGLYDRIMESCHKAGFSPMVVQEATQFQTAVGLVCVGMGIALLPSSMTALKRDGVVYVRLKDEAAIVETLIVRMPGTPRPAVTHLMAVAATFGEMTNQATPLF